MIDVSKLINDSKMIDVLAEEREYKEPKFIPPPKPIIEDPTQDIPTGSDPTNIDQPINEPSIDDQLAFEMTGESLAALFELPVSAGMFMVNKRFQKKLTGEEWSLVEEIRVKQSKKEKLEDEEIQLLNNLAFNEKELAEIKEDLEYTDRERERILYACTKYAEVTGKKMTPGQMLATTLFTVIGPRAARVFTF